jgi:hypothetical protein
VEFSLRERTDRGAMELLVFVDSPRPVAEALLRLVDDAVKTTMPSLRFALAVPALTGGRWSAAGGPPPDLAEGGGVLAILDGDRGLAALVEAGAANVPVGPGRVVSAAEARRTFGGWLPAGGPLAVGGYDAFLSYRQGDFDSELTAAVFAQLSDQAVGGRGVRVFLDRRRLEGGRDFRGDFARALASATVAVPVVSWRALQRMLELGEDSEVDNVLLEWTLMLELVAAGRVRRCFPVVLGRVGRENGPGEAHFSDLFAEGVVARLPAVVVRRVADAAAEALRQAGVAESGRLRSRTVRATVEDVVGRLGVVVPAAAAPPSAHAEEALRRDLFRRVADGVMGCVDGESQAAAEAAGAGATLEGWTVDEVAGFFRARCQMGGVADRVVANSVDGKLLCGLSAELLRDEVEGLGMKLLQLMRARQELERLKVRVACNFVIRHRFFAARLTRRRVAAGGDPRRNALTLGWDGGGGEAGGDIVCMGAVQMTRRGQGSRY